MKVIDLIQKIANGEEVPKKIKVLGVIYYYCGKDKTGNCYYSEPEGCGGIRLSFNTSQLNEEVEILKEEKKIPEKLKKISKDYWLEAPDNFDLMNKINEIIDYLEENK